MRSTASSIRAFGTSKACIVSATIAQPFSLSGRPARVARPWAIDLLVQLATRKPLGFFGAIIVATSVVLAILADVIAPYSFDAPDYGATLQGPTMAHIMGTDFLGRDLFSRLVHGSRVTIVVIVGAVGLGTVVSGLIGICSGYFGGRFDAILQRFVDAWMSIPPVLFLLFAMAIVGPSIQNMIVVLGLLAIRESRVIRAAVLSIRDAAFVDAARVIGCSHRRILLLHILPNVIVPIIILTTLRAGTVVLLEATLSFLGYGIPPPFPAWGRMLSAESRTYKFDAPWLAIWPGIFLSLTVFGWNVLGDALRDLLDPRLKGVGRSNN
jgi:peptide/nickel transport system permease protein